MLCIILWLCTPLGLVDPKREYPCKQERIADTHMYIAATWDVDPLMCCSCMPKSSVRYIFPGDTRDRRYVSGRPTRMVRSRHSESLSETDAIM